MPQNVISQITLATLLFVVLGFLVWRNNLEHAGPQTGHAAETDQRFTGFVARQFGASGQLQWTLHGKTVQHDTGDRGYAMSAPELIVTDRQHAGPPWRLSAPIGTANEALTDIRLSGGVIGQRAAYNRQGPLRFRSETLDISPRTDTARSDDKSRFAELDDQGNPVWSSDATSFRLNYREQRLEQSQVQDSYRPAAIVQTPTHATRRPDDSPSSQDQTALGAQP